MYFGVLRMQIQEMRLRVSIWPRSRLLARSARVDRSRSVAFALARSFNIVDGFSPIAEP